MKKFYLLLSFLITSALYAQIPAGYYDSANGNGYTLKTQLKEIIDDNNDGLATEYIAFQNTYDDLYTAYQTTDIDNFTTDIYENDGTVLDMYSESVSTTMGDPYNFNHNSTDQCGSYTGEGQCYNREHLFAQGFFNQQLPMKSDVHFVVPTDGYVNNRRSNYPFGEVSSPTWISQNGSKVGSNTSSPSYTGSAFEPIDEFKGDIARMLLYFAVRYEDDVTSGSWDAHDAVPENPLNGTNDQVYENWYIELLLNWHALDPVSPREVSRNEACFTFQNNRNPFIDHPEWVGAIWNPTADTQAPDAITDLVTSNPSSSTIDLAWSEPYDNVGVTSYDIYIDGSNTFNTSNTSFTVTGLTSETNYCFTVFAKDAAGNISGISNQDCATTLATGGGTVDLFFSEYVEGGSTNKALEIANFTGSSVNLSSYTLKLASNTSNFSYTYTFPNGSIANGDVFVVANSGLLPACQSQQDDVNNSITGFNGNDAIGLFKNDVLIDIIGIEADGVTFAENVTLIRKPTVEFPTTTFDSNEWNTAAQDDCSNLGSHNQTLTIEDNTDYGTLFYPNPLKGNSLNIITNKSLNMEIFNVLGKRILFDSVNSNKQTINVSSLKRGIYLIKLSNRNEAITKKLIRQ